MDLLSAGPERVRPPRRRWVTGVLAGVVAVAAVVLAARATPDAPVRPPEPTVAPREPLSAVVTTAVGDRWAYALSARCETSTRCGWDLHRRELAGGGWARTGLRTTARDSAGLPPLLYAAGDSVTVVDEADDDGMVWFSPDGGTTVRTGGLRTGEPLDALPADGVLDPSLCSSCAFRLTVLRPGDFTLHLLRSQPPVGEAGWQRISVSGRTIWVVSTNTRGEVVPAVSRDSGRTWRTVPARGFPTGEETVLVTAGPGGSAYLLGAQVSPAGPGPLAEAWHAAGPTAAFRKLDLTQNPPGPISVVPDGADAVLTDHMGQVWRLRPDGTVGRLPDAALDGRLLGPGVLAAGPGGQLLGLPVDELRRVVVFSPDRGRSWSVESVGD